MPMKLTRITRLRHRVFRDFTWPRDLHPFGRFNVVYGWNGSGKTTLSTLLSLIEKRTELTEGEIELELDGRTTITGAELATKAAPQVRVFNRDFISATLQSARGIAPIYYLGEENVEKQREVEKLKGDLAAAQAAIESVNGEKEAAHDALDAFCRTKAKVIKDVLTTGNSPGYNNYDKRRFRQAALALDPGRAAAALLADDVMQSLRRQKDAQPKPAIEKLAAPTVDLAALSSEVDALVRRSVVAQTLDELNGNAKLASWVQAGLALHTGEMTSDRCRFCEQPLEAARRAALEAHFNDSFARLQRDASTMLETLARAKQSVDAVRPPEAARFYETVGSGSTAANASLATACAQASAALDALIARAQAKRDNPFAPAPAAAPGSAAPSSLAAAVAAVNLIVDQHNQISAQFKASVDAACKKLETSYVAEGHADFVRLSHALTKAEAKLAEIEGRPGEIQGRIDILERAILEHRRPADELTDELRAYLGRDELRFEVEGTGYVLTRDGQPVSHLSEGERTAIAFLYFLKSLQDKTFDLAKGIVVIDDPVSSLDANALFSASSYVRNRTGECGQLFIFTHSFPFFREMKNWFRHINENLKKGETAPRFFLLRSARHASGARTSYLGPLDRLLEKHDSEYEFLFKRVYVEAHRTDVDSLEHHYGLPNVARRLLETFLAFRFPNVRGGLYARLAKVSFDSTKKTRILRLLHDYSHAGGLVDLGHDLLLLTETQQVLVDLLAMMKVVDKEHYDGLEALLASDDLPRPGP